MFKKNKDTNIHDHLPDKHRFSHEYCFFLHDLMLDVIVELGKADLINTVIKKTEEEEDAFFNAFNEKNYEGSELLNLLESHGKFVEIFMFFYKQVYIALLSDLLHFVYEGLQCSKKGKMTVTFSLLRKPFTENLLYLEYLLADPGTFVHHFWKGDIEHFALGQKEKIDKQIFIKSIYEKYNLFSFEEPDLIYELRYRKDSARSFQTYFQHATHLVTQARSYKTTNTNFNFIFSTQEDLESQWEGLYDYLPILLHHTYEVVEALTVLVGKRAGQNLDITDHRVKVGYLLWENSSSRGNYGADNNLEDLVSLFDLQSLKCMYCNKNGIKSTLDNYLTFYKDSHINCSNCNRKNDLNKPFKKLAKEELDEQASNPKEADVSLFNILKSKFSSKG